MGEGH